MKCLQFVSMCLVLSVLLGIGTVSPVVLAKTETDRGLDVPFAPVSDEMTAELFRMAAITKDDLVYDLGCGDGRRVVAAAKQFGVKGVGIDPNPERIREARQNAASAGVADRVQFVESNLFDADISQATVVMLYLLPSVNLRLRPKLLEELKPGARIVSVDFNMGDWKPDVTAKIKGTTVYRWVVPANLSGTWEWNLPTRSDGGAMERYVGRFVQKFQNVSGAATMDSGPIPMGKASISGDRIRFSVVHQGEGRERAILFDGRIDGDIIRGKAYRNANRTGGATPWEATRKSMTIAQMEE